MSQKTFCFFTLYLPPQKYATKQSILDGTTRAFVQRIEDNGTVIKISNSYLNSKYSHFFGHRYHNVTIMNNTLIDYFVKIKTEIKMARDILQNILNTDNGLLLLANWDEILWRIRKLVYDTSDDVNFGEPYSEHYNASKYGNVNEMKSFFL